MICCFGKNEDKDEDDGLFFCGLFVDRMDADDGFVACVTTVSRRKKSLPKSSKAKIDMVYEHVVFDDVRVPSVLCYSVCGDTCGRRERDCIRTMIKLRYAITWCGR